MPPLPRRAIDAAEKGVRKVIGAPILEDGGKLNPAKLPGSGIEELTKPPKGKIVAKRIVQRQQDGKTVFCVEGKTTGRSFGCFPTRAQAKVRLQQIERFAQKSKNVKLTNKRARLRNARVDNLGERCSQCSYFVAPTTCAIVDGPVAADLVCDWIQSRGVKNAPRYKVATEDWIAFNAGMMAEQPYQHIVRDAALTPEGPLVMIQDTAKLAHNFSLSEDFHIEHTSLEHHWTQSEVDRLIKIGRQKIKAAKATKTQNLVAKRLFVPIAKINLEEQTITGVVLQPEIVDAQGDIISAEVIRRAAHRFLADHNRVTKLGLMHKNFKRQFELFESFIAPVDLVIGTKVVKAGSWVIVVHVLIKKIWDQVKGGKLTGFSIGGKAKVSKSTLVA